MKLYLLGAANPESIRVVRAVERAFPNITVPGMLDNDYSKHGTDFFGIPVLGGVDLVTNLAGPDAAFVTLVTGSTVARYETGRAIVTRGGELGNLIHPSVDLTMTVWGSGNYVKEGVIVQAGVRVGDNSSISMGAVIGHESVIGNSVFIAPGVAVSGCCNIGDGTLVGTNATILPRLNIGRWATIGAGSVVTKDVPDHAVVIGNPARQIRSNKVVHVNGSMR